MLVWETDTEYTSINTETRKKSIQQKSLTQINV